MSLLLVIQIVLFGTAVVWLLAFIPAGLITALKGHTRLLGWGCLTGGLLWIVGALTLAPADSRWARRCYTPGQCARAKGSFDEQRSSRTFAIWTASAISLILVFGFCAARPAPILGLNGTAIGDSLPHRGGGAFFSFWPPLGPCEQESSEHWSCAVYDDEGSGGTVSYRVKIDSLGCWTAVPTHPGGRGNFSGCLTILDYL